MVGCFEGGRGGAGCAFCLRREEEENEKERGRREQRGGGSEAAAAESRTRANQAFVLAAALREREVALLFSHARATNHYGLSAAPQSV